MRAVQKSPDNLTKSYLKSWSNNRPDRRHIVLVSVAKTGEGFKTEGSHWLVTMHFGVHFEESRGDVRGPGGLHGHVHLGVLVVTLALVKLRLGVVCIQLEEEEEDTEKRRHSS